MRVGGITPAGPRKDQPKTNRELLTLSWVRPNHLNLLTHSVTPPSPKACWCDLSICSQNDKGGRTWIGQSSLPPLFSLISPLHFVTLMDLLTPTLPPMIPHLPILFSTGRCFNSLMLADSYHQTRQKGLDKVELVNIGI